MRDRPHDEVMIERYRKDPEYALEFLNYLIEEDDQESLLIALRQMSAAFGGVYDVAKLNPELSRILSEKGNTALSALTAILHAIGLRLSITPIETAAV